MPPRNSQIIWIAASLALSVSVALLAGGCQTARTAAASTGAGTVTTEKKVMKIVCLGDSITGQPNLTKYLKWSAILEAMCDAAHGPGAVQVVNRGIGGDTTEGALKRLPGDVLDEQPAIVVILLGGNDAGQKRPPAAVQADLTQIVRRAQAGGARVLLLQYAVIPNPAHPETAWSHLDANNDLIATVARTEKAACLNLAPLMRDALAHQQVSELQGRQDGVATWATKPLTQEHLVSATDGVHLNPGGELVVARAVYAELAHLGWLPGKSER